jgi:translation initiation factor 1
MSTKGTSLADLASLLGADAPKAEEPKWKKGYDGATIRLKVRLEKRRGKDITIIQGFQARPKELNELLARLKASCGCGGQALDNVLELQGDHREKVTGLLRENGYKM